MQITHSLAKAIFPGYQTWPGKNVFECVKKFAVEVKNVENKMFAKRPKVFFGFNVLLSANMAIVADNSGSAV